MNLQVSPWLPAATRADLEAMMRLVVERWLADWVAAPKTCDIVTPARAEGDIATWHGDTGRWLQVAAEDVVSLGLSACNGRADQMNPVDRELLRHIGEAMRDDLLGRLGVGGQESPERGHGNAGRDGSDGAKHRFRVTEAADGWSLLIAIDENALVRLRKTTAGPSRTPLLMPLTEALAGEAVQLGCHLGHTEITAADLTALVPGDVLVLDRRLDGPVPLTVDGKLPRAGQARIGGQGASIEVKLTEAIDVMQGF